MRRGAFIELRDIRKAFGGVQALDGVTMSVEARSIHGLVGENGAGKSTLGRIIGGVIERDDGDLLIEGRAVNYRSPREALADGIAVISQEPALVPDLTVAENIFLGVEETRWGKSDRHAMCRRYAALENRARFELSPESRVGSLSIADQQKVEILRAVARGARLIVMDEPTSSLSREESERLHEVARSLRVEGMTIVYVTHFLEEVLELADRVTVLRNGKPIETIEAEGATVERLVLDMLGRAVSVNYPERKPPAKGADVVLRVRELSRAGGFEKINFDIRRGEIVGLAGLVGSGRTEIARSIFGADPVESGTVELEGRPLQLGSPRRAVDAGIGFAPEDRKQQGLLMELSQRVNVTLPHLKTFRRHGITAARAEQRVTTRLLQKLRVVPPDPDRPVKVLSGGNQQKVLFAKWLLRAPKLIILDEPTRGVDVGAKQAIYELIAELASEGMAVLMISSELEEILGLAHRVVVIRQGRIEAEFDALDLSSEAVMHAAFGIDREALIPT